MSVQLENEIYRYDEGYRESINFIKSQIEILQKKYPQDLSLLDLLLIINSCKHVRADIDKIAELVIREKEKTK